MDHLLLDVSGPHAPVSNVSNATDGMVPENFQVIYAKNLDSYNFVGPVVNSSTQPRSQTKHLAGETVVRYFRRSETGPGVRILDILPSLSVLKKNEVCRIYTGNEQQQLFHLKSKKGIHSLRFSKKLTLSSVHYLELNCRQIFVVGHKSDSKNVLNTKIRLELHVL